MSLSETVLKVHVDAQRPNKPIGGWLKRTFDVVAATGLLVFLAPIFLIIALTIKITDPGPVFYRHRRIGYNGQSFYCLKFRSMVMNSSEVLAKILAEDPEMAAEWRANQKFKVDPRITGIGRFLRESSLDELPQLLNVLRGDMSLVGPRPIVDDEVSHYAANIGHYRRARPGITGLWQVSGRSDCTYETRVQHDVNYVHRWSFFSDIAILLKTAVVVVSREGSR